MTNPNLTHITMLVDRSGSMQAIRTDAEGAVNRFIEEQKALDKPCTLHLVDFDAPQQHGPSWLTTHHDGLLAEAAPYVLTPRGWTALLDAVGMTITTLGERLSSIPEDERPGQVIFLVQTDGQENSSLDWSWEQISELVKRQHEDYGWHFVMLGTGPEAWGQGERIGTQSVTRAAAGGQSFVGAYANASQAVLKTRATGDMAFMAMADADVDAEGNVTARGD